MPRFGRNDRRAETRLPEVCRNKSQGNFAMVSTNGARNADSRRTALLGLWQSETSN
jgi:hypothetical protein